MSTKIINVLKDDRFEEIIDLFKKASADEVIFVLPKRSRAFEKEDNFAVLAAEAKEQSKDVLILASNPEVINLAIKYDFAVLTANKIDSSEKFEKKEKETKASLVSDMTDTNDEIDDETDDKTGGGIYNNDEDKNKSEDNPKEFEEESREEDKEELGEEVEEEQFEEETQDDVSSFLQSGFEEQPMYNIDLAMAEAKTKTDKSMADIIKVGREEAVKIKIVKRGEQPLRVEINKSKDDQKRSNLDIIDEIQDVWRSATENGFNFSKRKPKISAKIFLPQFQFLSRNKTIILGAMATLAVLVAVYFYFGSAYIVIKPKAHPLDVSLKIFSSDKFLSVNLGSKTIPGQLFSIEKKVEETFPATGERDVVQKARGRITIYNEYGTTPQVLIATTRFQSVGVSQNGVDGDSSAGGLVFRTLKTITVPGTKVENGKIIPGSVEVEVIADKAGEVYNIGATKFTIPAFKEKGDMNRFDKFYGISSEPMKGGIIGKAKVVIEQDYVNAKKTVEEKIKSGAENDLKNQSTGLKILNLPIPEVKELVSTAQIDEATDSFAISGMSEIEIVGFKEKDLHDLVASYVNETNNLLVFPEKLQIEFKDINFNKDTKILGFTAVVKGSAYDKIEEEKIISDLAGKDEGGIKEYINGIDGIASTKIILSPFWIRKVPDNKERIKIEIQYN